MRAPEYVTDTDESSDTECPVRSDCESSQSDSQPIGLESTASRTSPKQLSLSESNAAAGDSIANGAEAVMTNAEWHRKMEDFENTLKNLVSVLGNNKQHNRANLDTDDAERSWNTTRIQTAQNCPVQGIRWDHIKSFPKDIPANKMWEAWNKYIENFEIAASLGNAFEPSRRAQLLFLSVGEEMQAIIRAARLRPNLDGADCYERFVSNIDSYLKSMTDASAEHEAFSNMRQGMDESVMGFHARLVEKVRLCGYSRSDQERFVRAQLIKGMSNQVLAKSARTYGHDVNLIVQSATREEAFDREAGPSHRAGVFALRGSHYSQREPASKRVRPNPNERHTSKSKTVGSGTIHPPGRRDRCSRCYYPTHRGETCPALSRKCNKCGMQGHFAATCRTTRVNDIRQHQKENPCESKDHDQVKGNN